MASSSHNSKAAGTATTAAASRGINWDNVINFLNAQEYPTVYQILVTPDDQRIILLHYPRDAASPNAITVVDTTSPRELKKIILDNCLTNSHTRLFSVSQTNQVGVLNQRQKTLPQIYLFDAEGADEQKAAEMGAEANSRNTLVQPQSLQAINFYIEDQSGKGLCVSLGPQSQGSGRIVVVLPGIDLRKKVTIDIPLISRNQWVIRVNDEFFLINNMDFNQPRRQAIKLNSWKSLFSSFPPQFELILSPDGRFIAAYALHEKLKVYRVLNDDLENLILCSGMKDICRQEPVWNASSDALFFSSRWYDEIYYPRKEITLHLSHQIFVATPLLNGRMLGRCYDGFYIDKLFFSQDKLMIMAESELKKRTEVISLLVSFEIIRDLALIILDYAELTQAHYMKKLFYKLPDRFSHLQERVNQCVESCTAEKKLKELHALELLIEFVREHPEKSGNECVNLLWQEPAFAKLKDQNTQLNAVCRIIGSDKKPILLAQFSIMAPKKEIIPELITLFEALKEITRQSSAAGPDTELEILRGLQNQIREKMNSITREEVCAKIIEITGKIRGSKIYEEIKPAFDHFTNSTVEHTPRVQRGGGAS